MRCIVVHFFLLPRHGLPRRCGPILTTLACPTGAPTGKAGEDLRDFASFLLFRGRAHSLGAVADAVLPSRCPPARQQNVHGCQRASGGIGYRGIPRTGATNPQGTAVPQHVGEGNRIMRADVNRTERNASIVCLSQHQRHFRCAPSGQHHHNRYTASSGQKATYFRAFIYFIDLRTFTNDDAHIANYLVKTKMAAS